MRFRRALLALLALSLAVSGLRTAHAATVIHLPFPAGTAISTIQGYNGGTHQGVERYSLDLTRDDGKTSGSPALAPAAGTVVWSYPPGTGNGCVGIQIDGGAGLHEMLCHLFLNHNYTNGEHVTGAQVLGTVGRPGTVGNNGTAHVHLQLYRVINGDRTPVPFALPDGAPLEGVSLAAGSSYNQWACANSGPSCHIASLNNGSTVPAATPTPGTITSASSNSTGGATVRSPRQQGDGLAIGVAVVVSGTGDCLKVHALAATSAAMVYCLPDGTQAVIGDGPQVADGFTWFKLGDLGWSVADYLVPLNSGNVIAAPPAPAAGASATPAPAAASPAASAPTPAAPTVSAPAPELENAVPFVTGAAVIVTGTGDCLRVHDDPSTAGTVVDCLVDGTTGRITDGPVRSDGYTWWKLDGRGWVVGDYLKAQ